MTALGSIAGSTPWRLATRNGRLPSADRSPTTGGQGDGPVPIRDEVYICLRKHRTALRFAASATSPTTWECRTCSQVATLEGVDVAPADAVWPGRQLKRHEQQLHERRTVEELEALLAERLQMLRSGVMKPVDEYLSRTPHIYRS